MKTNLYTILCTVIRFGAVLMAIQLWLFPGGVARLAAAKSAQQVFESPISGQELQQIAFAVLGVWLVVGGLIDVGRESVRASLIAHANDMAFTDLRAHDAAQLLGNAIEIAFGVLLTFGARGFAGLLYRLRYGAAIAQADPMPHSSQGNQ